MNVQWKWYTYKKEYYAAEEKNVIKFVGRWKDLKYAILSEVTQW